MAPLQLKIFSFFFGRGLISMNIIVFGFMTAHSVKCDYYRVNKTRYMHAMYALIFISVLTTEAAMVIQAASIVRVPYLRLSVDKDSYLQQAEKQKLYSNIQKELIQKHPPAFTPDSTVSISGPGSELLRKISEDDVLQLWQTIDPKLSTTDSKNSLKDGSIALRPLDSSENVPGASSQSALPHQYLEPPQSQSNPHKSPLRAAAWFVYGYFVAVKCGLLGLNIYLRTKTNSTEVSVRPFHRPWDSR